MLFTCTSEFVKRYSRVRRENRKISAGAEGGSRTRTSLRTTDFKSAASAIPPPRHAVKIACALRSNKLLIVHIGRDGVLPSHCSDFALRGTFTIRLALRPRHPIPGFINDCLADYGEFTFWADAGLGGVSESCCGNLSGNRKRQIEPFEAGSPFDARAILFKLHDERVRLLRASTLDDTREITIPRSTDTHVRMDTRRTAYTTGHQNE